MAVLEKENIFLMEFMVDHVTIDYNGRLDLKFLSAETCVSYTFLGNGPFFICEDDFIPQKRKLVNGCSGCGNIKNGKSILFSLTPQLISDARQQFDMDLEVHKKTMPDSEPDKVFVGSTQVNLKDLFDQLLECVEKSGPPCTKAMKTCFTFNGLTGERTGQISVYIRMSCFGKVIVTKFQMNLDVESVEFSAKEGRCLYKYNKKDNYPNDPCSTGYPCVGSCPAVSAARDAAIEARVKMAAEARIADELDRSGRGGKYGDGFRSGKVGHRSSKGGSKFRQSGIGAGTGAGTSAGAGVGTGTGTGTGTGAGTGTGTGSSKFALLKQAKKAANIPFIAGPNMSGSQVRNVAPSCSNNCPCPATCPPKDPCRW